jgi:hypothetical protein
MILPHRRPHKGSSITGALVLIFIGGMFLAGTMLPGVDLGDVFTRGWPFLLILLGVIGFVKAIVTAPLRGRLELMGPIVLLTIGGLFVLQEWFRIGFDRTWPVMLLVIGVALLFRKLLAPIALALPFGAFLRRRR